MPWRFCTIRAFSPLVTKITSSLPSGRRQLLVRSRIPRPLPFSTSAAFLNHHDTPSIASVLARPAAELEGREITVTGTVRTIRTQKHHAFLKLGDGSTATELQALLSPAQAQGLHTGTAIRLTGRWTRSPGAEQPFELQAARVAVVGPVDPAAYPLQKKYHSPEFLRTLPHLRLRLPFNNQLARLRSDVEFHLGILFRERDYVRVTPPIITSSDCEGAGEVFTLRPRAADEGPSAPPFFKDAKYLTVSAQLHLEAFAAEHKRVWALAPTFRAERSDTPRHLSEFYMLEAELQTERLGDVMDVVEEVVRHVALGLEHSPVGRELRTPGKHGGETEVTRCGLVQQRWKGLVRESWPRITYSEAIMALEEAAASKRAASTARPRWGQPLHIEHERYAAEVVGQGSPVFVTHYPRAIKPFYMLPSEAGESEGHGDSNRATAACFDLLLPGQGEVVGGSLREHRLEPLEAQMRAAGLLAGQHGSSRGSPATGDREKLQETTPGRSSSSTGKGSLDWYLDLRRYGSVPHGGFGLGFDRLLGYLAGVDNVRDVVPWPRYFGRCDG